MSRCLRHVALSLAVACVAMVACATTAFAAEAYPAQSMFTYLQVAGGEDLQVNAVDFEGDIGETVFLEVKAGDRTIVKNLPHELGAAGAGADVSGKLSGDVFVISGDVATIEGYLEAGLYVTAYSDRTGKTALIESKQVHGVYASAADGSFERFLMGTYTEGMTFKAPDTIVVENVAYRLASHDGDEYTYEQESTEGSVDGAVTYYDVKTGDALSCKDVIAAIAWGEVRNVTVPDSIESDGATWRTLSFVNSLTAGWPGQTSFSIPCVKVDDAMKAEFGHYLATIEMRDQDGTLIASDSVFVAGSFAYAPPTAIYQSRPVAGETEVFAYENPTWEGQSDGDAAIMLDAATDGVTSGSRTIVVTYTQTQGNIEHEVQFNLIDGTARQGSRLLEAYTDDALVASAENKTVVLPASKSAITVDGTTYNIVGSTEDYSFTYGVGQAPVVDVYYVPEGYDTSTDEPYDVTIRYVNYATGALIATETATSSPELLSELQINTPAEFVEGGVTYVRLDGQERPISHNYYSHNTEYTVYYRDANDTLTANTVITNVRTVYRNTGTGTAATPAATAATPAATATTPATPVAATNPATEYTAADGDGATGALTTPSGTDANQERIDDVANPLASGIEGGSAIDGNAPDATAKDKARGVMAWVVPAIATAAVLALGAMVMLMRRRNDQLAAEQLAQDDGSAQTPSEEQ